jgi:hypothetical protein
LTPAFETCPSDERAHRSMVSDTHVVGGIPCGRLLFCLHSQRARAHLAEK